MVYAGKRCCVSCVMYNTLILKYSTSILIPPVMELISFQVRVVELLLQILDHVHKIPSHLDSTVFSIEVIIGYTNILGILRVGG